MTNQSTPPTTNNNTDRYKYVPLWQKVLRTSVLTFLLMTILLGAVLPPVIHYGRRQEALAILGEARSVELTFRLLALDYYGRGIQISSPERFSGMTKEAEAEVSKMSMTEGQILLQEWSEEEMRPLAFSYREGNYVVQFTAGPLGEKSHWEVYRVTKLWDFE